MELTNTTPPQDKAHQADDLHRIATSLQQNLDIRDRKYHCKTYKECFIGSDAVAYMVSNGLAENVEAAISLGDRLIDNNYMHHVVRDHTFKNQMLFYRFLIHDDHRGKAVKSEPVSWESVLTGAPPSFVATDRPYNHHADIDEEVKKLPADSRLFASGEELPTQHTDMPQKTPHIPEMLLDPYNIITYNNVRPAKFEDPKPVGKYNMVAIGSGAGGLVASIGAGVTGGKSAIIERHFMGGDCLNTGCVPSKAIIKCAHEFARIKEAAKYGVVIQGEVKLDFGKVMERVRRVRAEISYHDSVAKLTDHYGVDVYLGEARFQSQNTLVVNGQVIEFSKCCIASGGRPRIPDVPGINTVPLHSSENIWNLLDLPPRMIFIGAGPIGCELAQAFQTFGSEVSMIYPGKQFLAREEREAADILHKVFLEQGVKLYPETNMVRVEKLNDAKPFPTIRVVVKGPDGTEQALECEVLVLAAGRVPNVEDLNLEAAGVEYNRQGIVINDKLRTTNKNIYAVGDCCFKYQFTHVADRMARMVIKNALYFGSEKLSNLIIPWCTYTEPEVAHVGLYGHELEARGHPFQTYVKYFDENDRSICEGETLGYVKVFTSANSDEILGATIVGTAAGDMISEITLAMENKLGLGKLGGVIHPYPTRAESIKFAGDEANGKRLTVGVKKLLRTINGSRR